MKREIVVMMSRKFYCTKCDKTFQSEGYDNPSFLADKVSQCPYCDRKSWEESNTNNSEETHERRRKYQKMSGKDWTDVNW